MSEENYEWFLLMLKQMCEKGVFSGLKKLEISEAAMTLDNIIDTNIFPDTLQHIILTAPGVIYTEDKIKLQKRFKKREINVLSVKAHPKKPKRYQTIRR